MEEVRSRREVVRMAVGATLGAVAATTATPRATRGATGDPVIAGGLTEAMSVTHIRVPDGPVLRLEATTSGGALVASGSGTAVVLADGNGPGSAAVVGRSDISIGVGGYGSGDSETSVGVDAVGGLAGVVAEGSQGGIGVYATGSVAMVGDVGSGGIGVYGFAGDIDAPAPAPGVGVLAGASGNATALRVVGKAVFSRSGRISVGAGKASVSRSVAGVTTGSMVLAVLQTPEAGTWVRAAVPSAGKITIYFNRALPTSSAVAYFILN